MFHCARQIVRRERFASLILFSTDSVVMYSVFEVAVFGLYIELLRRFPRHLGELNPGFFSSLCLPDFSVVVQRRASSLNPRRGS